MKFKNLEELVKYVVSEPINLEYTDIVFEANTIEDKTSIKEENKTIENENFQVKIKNLFGDPAVDGSYSEENILFVESVEGNRDFCGSGKVNVLGREIITNLCESDGTAYVKLSIDINGKIVENVLFKLKASDALTKNTIQIKKDILND